MSYSGGRNFNLLGTDTDIGVQTDVEHEKFVAYKVYGYDYTETHTRAYKHSDTNDIWDYNLKMYNLMKSSLFFHPLVLSMLHYAS